MFVDLYNFEKIMNKAETVKGEKVENLKDMDAIFGDDQFYKDEGEEPPRDDLDLDDINFEPKESEYDMDKYYKIPV